jgi:hypothetical protein
MPHELRHLELMWGQVFVRLWSNAHGPSFVGLASAWANFAWVAFLGTHLFKVDLFIAITPIDTHLPLSKQRYAATL